MKQDYCVDRWRHELYRHIAQFVHNPDDRSQAKLTALITEFRRQSERHRQYQPSDEHEYAMNYC